MAEEGDAGEKSEEPTGRRREQSRTEGQVAVSRDLSQLLGMVAAFVAIEHISPMLWESLIILTTWCFTSRYSRVQLTDVALTNHFLEVLYLLMPWVILLMAISAFFGAGSTLLQTNFLWSSKLFKPRLKLLNPLAGIKRIFSPYNYMNLAKSLLKFCFIAPVSYFAFMGLFPEIIGTMALSVDAVLPFTALAADKIFWQLTKILSVIAIFDFFWQRYYTHKKMKMSKTEVKDEKKSIEGDEATKMRIRSKALQKARARMMAAVPTADVIVTNPTHYSVALKYDIKPGSAPEVVAKGKGHMALKIREIAKHHGVPVIERKSLARALYRTVEVGQTIPYELYAAVAELLAYVYKLKGSNPFAGKRNKK